MDSLFARLERVLEPVLAGLLAFITIGVFIQVVLRYVFAMSFLWGEELSLFAFIWCIFLGTAICSERRTHFSFDRFSGLRGRPKGVQLLVVGTPYRGREWARWIRSVARTVLDRATCPVAVIPQQYPRSAMAD